MPFEEIDRLTGEFIGLMLERPVRCGSPPDATSSDLSRMTRGDLLAEMDDAGREGDRDRWLAAFEAFLDLCGEALRLRHGAVVEAFRAAIGDEDLRPEGFATAWRALVLLGEVLAGPGRLRLTAKIAGCDPTRAEDRARHATALILPWRLMREQPPEDIRAEVDREAVEVLSEQSRDDVERERLLAAVRATIEEVLAQETVGA